VKLGAGAVRGAISPFAVVAGELIGGVNTPEGRAQGARWGGNVEKALTYTPQTQTAKDIIGYAGEKLQNVDFNAIPFAQGSVAAAMAPAATRQAASAIKNEAGYLKNAISEIPAVTKYAEDTAAANIKKSVENAGRVESAQFAPKYGILLNPEHSNPSTGANMRAGLIGDSDINAKMSAANEPKWNEAVKTGLNLPSNKKLTSEVFKEAHAAPELSKPYENARALPVVTADDSAVKSLSSLKLPELVSDVSGVSTKANKYLTELTKRLKKGTDGSNLLDSAIELRRDAQDILKADKITPLERKLAKMKQGAADIIETMGFAPEEVYWLFQTDEVLAIKNKYITESSDILGKDYSASNFVKAIVSNIALEGIYFFSGFLTFFNLDRQGIRRGTSNRIKHIYRDEISHLPLFVKMWHTLQEERLELFTQELIKECEQIIRLAVKYECEWGKYIIKEGVLGLTDIIVDSFIQDLANQRWLSLGFTDILYVDAAGKPVNNLAKWFDSYLDLNDTKTNFFENKVLTYETDTLEW